MNLSCGSRTIKYLIFSFNFFFVITGIILVAVGASIRAYFVQYDFFLNNQYFSLPNLLIATGSLIFVICFLGCYGAMKNSWILLMGFSILLGIIFIFEFSAGIAGYVLRDKTTNYLEKSMTDSLQQYFNKAPAATGPWDFIQENFECCGVRNTDDWTKLSGNYTLPVSCCPPQNGQWGVFSCNAYTPPPTSSPNPSSINVTNTTTSPATTNPPTTSATTNAPTTTATTHTITLTAEPSTGSSTSSASTAPAPPNPPDARKRRSLRVGLAEPSTNSSSTPAMPTTTKPYAVGCEEAFGSWVKAHAVDIGAVCFTLAVLQLIGIGFACHLSKQLKNSYYST